MTKLLQFPKKYLQIDLPHYGQKVHVFVGFSPEQIASKLCVPKMRGAFRGMGPGSARTARMIEEGFVAVSFSSLDNSPASIALVAHELWHATDGVMEIAGMEYCHESEEAYTYTLQNLIQRFFESAL